MCVGHLMQMNFHHDLMRKSKESCDECFQLKSDRRDREREAEEVEGGDEVPPDLFATRSLREDSPALSSVERKA